VKRAQDGFTLTELLVSMLILGIIVVSVLSAQLFQLGMNTRNEQITQAGVAAQRVMDGVRSTDPAAMPLSGSSQPVTVNVSGRAYKVTLTYCSPGTYCTKNARFIQVDVTVDNKNIFSVANVLTSVGSGIVSAGVSP